MCAGTIPFLVWLVSFYWRFRARWYRSDSNCYDDGIHPSKAAFANKRYFAYRISFGRVLGAIIAPQLIPVYGWKIMFYIGVIPLLLVPFIIKFLPKSIVFLLSRNRTEEAERIASRFRIPVNLVM